MRKIALLLVIILSLVALACNGGGGGSSTNGGSNQTPTPGSSQSEATVLEVHMTPDGLQPQTFEIKAGKSYKFRVVNETTRSRNFIVRRWEMNVPVEAEKTAESGPFSDNEVGASAVCNDQSRGSLPQWQCVVNIVAGG